jgi:hypothetical protein
MSGCGRSRDHTERAPRGDPRLGPHKNGGCPPWGATRSQTHPWVCADRTCPVDGGCSMSHTTLGGRLARVGDRSQSSRRRHPTSALGLSHRRCTDLPSSKSLGVCRSYQGGCGINGRTNARISGSCMQAGHSGRGPEGSSSTTSVTLKSFFRHMWVHSRGQRKT